MNTITHYTVLLMVLALTACNSHQADESSTLDISKKDSTVTSSLSRNDLLLMKAQLENKALYRTISGRVVPRNATDLYAEVQGRVLSGGITFKNGIVFSKGDVLLVLDDREFRLALESERSAFLNTLTSLMPDMKTEYPESYPQWLEYIQNYTSGTSLPPLPNPRSEREKYYITSYQVYSQFYAIKSKEERLTKYKIIAPYSGIITESFIDVGSLVSPRQLLGKIINRYNYELEAGIDITTRDHLKIGDKLTFSSNNVQGEWSGTLIRKNNIIDPSTQNIPLYFKLSGKGITPGMYLESSYRAGQYENVVILPTESIRRDNSVLILENNAIKSKMIETVQYFTDSVMVRGLAENEWVILNEFNAPVLGKKVSL